MNIRIQLNIYNDSLASFVFRTKHILFLCIGCIFVSPLWGSELSQTIETIKPSIVGIGTYQKTRSPAVNFMATGFVVDDGLHVVTNAHAIPKILDSTNMESLVVITASEGQEPDFRTATRLAQDQEHDIALLKISGTPLPAMQLTDSSAAREGQLFAFTGFPIGMILGFHPVTHRGMLSSITPIALPVHNAKQLDAKKITQLKKSAYDVFQLDGTAYPGNSGSPLYDPETGAVYGIINMVFVKGLKEDAISHPSGITYAIPGNHVRDLLRQIRP